MGVRKKVLAVKLLKVSRMERRTLKYHLHENYGFFNSPHTSVREKRIGREKYAGQSNVR